MGRWSWMASKWRIWNMVLAYFKILSQHSLKDAEKKHEHLRL